MVRRLAILIGLMASSVAWAQTCTSISYAAPSGASNNITFTFNTGYTCGQFANGDWWVVPATPTGTVTVNSISPGASTGRNGWAVNLVIPNPYTQPWDNRLSSFANTSPTLPFAAPANTSIIKTVSMATCSSFSCIQFAAVLTVLGTAPSSPSTTFRPPFAGTAKPLLSTNNLQTSALNRFPSSCCTGSSGKISANEALNRTKNFRLNYSPNSIDGYFIVPTDSVALGRTWGGDMWVYDTEVLAWLNLDNACSTPPCSAAQDLAAKMPTLISYVQHGIDIWAVDKQKQGYWRGGGGNGAGALMTYAFAAGMLNDATMKTQLANIDANDYTESGSFYRGRNNVALWGQLDPFATVADYWNELRNPPGSTKTIRDPHGYIDGGSIPGDFYQANLSYQTKYTSVLLRAMAVLKSSWPTVGDNANVIIDYGKRWNDHPGTWTLPDPCAPPTGTYQVNYGPKGTSSGGFLDCVAGNGRKASLDKTIAATGYRSTAFMEAFYDAVSPLVDVPRPNPPTGLQLVVR
jgi:hypothetical protein